MKQAFLFFALLLPLVASAHDFEEPNQYGDTIYYEYTNSFSEVVVSYKGKLFNEYKGEYSGDIVIPESVTHGVRTYPVTGIGDSAFDHCPEVTSVTIPSSVTSIGIYAFRETGLTSFNIPNTVTSIGEGAFSTCNSLTSVTIPNTLTIISSYMFGFCKKLTSVTIPGSVTIIDDHAFICTGLTSVVIPNAVTSIGEYAFSECSDLNSVTFGNSVESIGSFAFYECAALTSMDIPNSVTSIGDTAFQRCTGLTSLTIGKSLASIGHGAFYICSKSLTSISVDPDNPYYNSQNNCNAIIETASNTLILGCRNTVIPGTVTTISEAAFDACYALTSLTIPSSVTSIGDNAFANCRSLREIYCYAEECPTANDNIFYQVSENLTLHVLNVSEEAYKTHAPWTRFWNIVGDIPKPKCATPTITYRNGKLLFECETEYVEFVYQFTTPASGDSNSSEVSLPTAYTVTVYAKKPGCYDSDVVTQEVDIRGQANDVNGDGNITIADALDVVNMILSGPTE